MVKEIKLNPLYRNKSVLVDDEDYKIYSKFRWSYFSGYARYKKKIDGKLKVFSMHRLITNAPDDMDVDHINMDKLDNRRCNLRIVTRSQNCMNKRVRTTATSKYKGVWWHGRSKRWYVSIEYDGKRKYIGSYKDELQAAKAYNSAALHYHGEFARLNELEVA